MPQENDLQRLIQEQLVRLLSGAGATGGSIGISTKGKPTARLSVQPPSPTEALQTQVDTFKLRTQLDSLRDEAAAAAKVKETVRLAQDALEEANKSIRLGKIPPIADMEMARFFATEAGGPMTAALTGLEESVVKLVDAKAESTVADIAKTSRLTPDAVPDDIVAQIKGRIRETAQPLPRNTQAGLVRLLKRMGEKDRQIAATAGRALIAPPASADELVSTLRSGTSSAAKVILQGGSTTRRTIESTMSATEGVIEKGLAELGKTQSLKRLGKLGLGGLGAGLGGLILMRYLQGGKPEEKGGGMPSMQELMMLKAMTDIQTQSGLAESLIGLRQSQSEKARTSQEIEGLKAMQLLESLEMKSPGKGMRVF